MRERDGARLVSVIIPTFRRAVELERCISSVLASTYRPFEVIVVDDNAEESLCRQTQALVEGMAKTHGEGEIHYVRMAKHKGGSAARNVGFLASQGEYVMFLDDDDQFLTEKMGAQAAFLDHHGAEWGACYTRYVDRKNGRDVAQSGETRQGKLLTEELARNLFVHAGSNLMVRRHVMEALGGFDECFARNQDVELLIRLMKRWKLGFADVEGLIVNLHPRDNVDNMEVTAFFKRHFQQEIDALPEEDRLAVRKMLALQDIRAAVGERRDVTLAFRIMRKEGVTMGETADYLLHLVRRKRNHLSCGYDLNRLRRGRR